MLSCVLRDSPSKEEQTNLATWREDVQQTVGNHWSVYKVYFFGGGFACAWPRSTFAPFEGLQSKTPYPVDCYSYSFYSLCATGGIQTGIQTHVEELMHREGLNCAGKTVKRAPFRSITAYHGSLPRVLAARIRRSTTRTTLHYVERRLLLVKRGDLIDRRGDGGQNGPTSQLFSCWGKVWRRWR